MSLTSRQLRIGGMTCVNCQNKIEQKLVHTAGITEAKVSYTKGTCKVTYDKDVISLDDIIDVIGKLDYQVLMDGEEDGTDFGRIVSLLVIIVSLYVLLQQFGILNLLVPSQLADNKMGYGMLFVTGLLTSVHCIAMCGGINLSQCIPKGGAEKEEDKLAAFRPAFLYNLGRVISYTVIGFIFGGAGLLIGGGSGTGLPVLVQGILKLIAGAFMVIMGINMLGLFPWLRKLNLRMPRFLAVRIGTQKAKSRQPLVVGLLNGLMPCGPLQSMQIVALASGNPFTGAFSMFLFSLGTVPLMLGLGSIVSALGKKFTQSVMSVGAVLVTVLGLAMLSQGGSLSGLLLPDRLFLVIIALCILAIAAAVPFRKPLYKAASLAAALVIVLAGGRIYGRIMEENYLEEGGTSGEDAEMEDGVQVVHSTLTPGKYPNITVQAKVPVKWIIDAPAGSINGCNYKMLLNEYNIEYTFQEGENVIEFTPEETGTFGYTCWMGMIRGNIFVTAAEGTAEGAANTADSAGSTANNVPVPAGYQIPSDQLAVAVKEEDENGNTTQKVSINLTEDGFQPAVVVVEANIQASWNIDMSLDGGESGIKMLVPDYATVLDLKEGENLLYLYPSESFEVSTGDNAFYAYVKVVDSLDQIDEDAIRQEVDGFRTMIYPDAVFESTGTGASCCS